MQKFPLYLVNEVKTLLKAVNLYSRASSYGSPPHVEPKVQPNVNSTWVEVEEDHMNGIIMIVLL